MMKIDFIIFFLDIPPLLVYVDLIFKSTLLGYSKHKC